MSESEQPNVDNDELTAFVASTLRAIASGVQSAGVSVAKLGTVGHQSFDIPSKISFDIAVTAKRSSEAGGGFKVQVFMLGAGVDGKKISESETVSRILFEVPWSYKSSHPTNVPSTKTAWNN